MTLTKDQVKSIVTSQGTHTIARPSTPAELSSLRSRLWQAAKRSGNAVSCKVSATEIVVTVKGA